MKEADFLNAIREHEGILRKITYLYADTQEDRRDLQQEIILQAWKSSGKFRGKSAFSTWLYRVGLNTALTFRKKENRVREMKADIVSEWDDQQPAPRSERADQLLQAIKTLDDADKTIITLHLEGFKNPEIAQLVGIKAGYVAVKLHRIRENLKEKLLQPSSN